MRDAAARAREVDRIVAVNLDPLSLGGAAAHVAHERDIAARDLIETNRFAPHGQPAAAWRLTLGLVERRLILDIAARDAAPDAPALRVALPLAQLRRLINDYYLTCDSYYAAVRAAPAETVEAIDHARKAIHDDGAALIRDRLAATVTLDAETARRLFTLVATLFWHG